jgi:enoyl-CoA hydratase/carnithine racemase
VENGLIYSELDHCRIIDLGGTEAEMIELAEVCDRIAWDEEAWVVLLAFGPGFSERLPKREASQASFAELVAKLKQPVIAAIRGDAIGLGLELALACDIRIATKGARFGLPQVKEGRIPSNGGTQRLPRLVGQGKALQMILTGEPVDAEEACRIGLINRVVASESLMATAMEMAQEMAAKSPLSLSYVKEALYSSRDLTLDQGLKMELDLYLLLFTTSDRTEGITAFREKRKPDFRGN